MLKLTFGLTSQLMGARHVLPLAADGVVCLPERVVVHHAVEGWAAVVAEQVGAAGSPKVVRDRVGHRTESIGLNKYKSNLDFLGLPRRKIYKNN